MFEFREINGEYEYDSFLAQKDAPLTQRWLYGDWQKMTGRKVRRFAILRGSEAVAVFQAVVYPLIFSKKFIYIPHAPLLRASFAEVATKAEQDYEGQAEFLIEFHEKLVKIGKKENAIFARFDFWPKLNLNSGNYFKKTPHYQYCSSYFQPKYEWILDLSKTEENILSGMHPKTRYNIRLAEKRGIKIEIINDNFDRHFNDFHKLMEATAKRDNFSLHPKSYYENIFSALGGSASGGKIHSENAFLAVAKYGDKILAINLILLFGKTAYFLFGGSSDEYKNLMFSHLAQWEAVKEAKNRGFEVYNFGGVDVDGAYETFGGISIFKKRFGGKLLEYSDSYDLVLKPVWYRLYNLRKWALNLKYHPTGDHPKGGKIK